MEVGRRLTADFLAGPVGAALAARVAEAERLNEVLELGVEVADPGLADLPWEALQVPRSVGGGGAEGDREPAGAAPKRGVVPAGRRAGSGPGA